ncbi:MAG: PHP domain-containing protein [archaeon]
MAKNADLHTHSYYSDGDYSPAELVRLAKKKGIKNLALTDHASVNGVEEAVKEGKKIGVRVIPAVEVIVKGTEVLGYFIDYKNKKLKAELRKCAFCENKKLKKRVYLLKKMGFNISYSKLEKDFPHSKGNYNTAHLFMFLIRKEKISLEESKEIIANMKVKVGGKKHLKVIDGIRLVKECGGVPVLAHPWLFKRGFTEKNIRRWIKAGLKGVEVENGEENNVGRTKEFVKEIRKMAKKYNLILTSGSDFHGSILTKLTGTHKLGEYNCDEKVVKELERLKQ